MRSAWLPAVFITLLVTVFPASANAQVYLTPYGGASFGADAPSTKPAFGASVTFMGRVAGFEVDLGYSPDFFNEAGDDVVLVGDSNVTSLMGNFVLAVGNYRVRPYGVVGLGLLRSRVDGGDFFDDVSTNDFGFNVGFGAMGMVTERVGFRGDLRYLRSLEDPEVDDDFDVDLGNFDFWRATAGVTFRF